MTQIERDKLDPHEPIGANRINVLPVQIPQEWLADHQWLFDVINQVAPKPESARQAIWTQKLTLAKIQIQPGGGLVLLYNHPDIVDLTWQLLVTKIQETKWRQCFFPAQRENPIIIGPDQRELLSQRDDQSRIRSAIGYVATEIETKVGAKLLEVDPADNQTILLTRRRPSYPRHPDWIGFDPFFILEISPDQLQKTSQTLISQARPPENCAPTPNGFPASAHSSDE